MKLKQQINNLMSIDLMKNLSKDLKQVVINFIYLYDKGENRFTGNYFRF